MVRVLYLNHNAFMYCLSHSTQEQLATGATRDTAGCFSEPGGKEHTAEFVRTASNAAMPKHGFLTPKAIGNRIKAKGLSKLRWYCEMCQKQCRDENGFKCHQTSEGHLRQMRIFAENPEAVMKEV